MATTPQGAGDLKKMAYGQLEALLATSTQAMNNPANTQEARDAAFDLCNAVQSQLNALNLAVFNSDTVALQGAAAAEPPGIADLKTLQKKIAAIGNGIKEGAAILSGIGQAVAALKALY
ncbi:MAG: hypothetical protein ACRD3N_13830 [Terracidiphilus sp.]